MSFIKTIKEVIRFLIYPAIILGAVFCLVFALGNMQKRDAAEEKKTLEESIHRAVVNCYSIEGAYPETLDYVEEHYGLQIDHDRFDVFYEIFADNIMPEITVVPKEEAGDED